MSSHSSHSAKLRSLSRDWRGTHIFFLVSCALTAAVDETPLRAKRVACERSGAAAAAAAGVREEAARRAEEATVEVERGSPRAARRSGSIQLLRGLLVLRMRLRLEKSECVK